MAVPSPRFYITGKFKMRFLSVAACALAASLLSAGPSQSLTVDTRYDGSTFTIYGSIPNPIDIYIGYGIDLTFLTENFNAYEGDSWGITVYASTAHSWAQVGEIRSPSGTHYPEFSPNFVTISDTDRTIGINVFAGASGNVVMNDAWAEFYLPDNLSTMAPVPEPASWALLILGFASIGLIRYYRPNRAGTVASQATAAHLSAQIQHRK
jgi:hypothetical protein